MKVRHPPGRAGRPWLVHRLAVARRGAELLDEKFRALAREHARLEPQAAQAGAEWEHSAREAERWLTRAAVMSGERQLALAAAAIPAPASVTVGWRAILGVSCPADATVARGSEASLAGGAALLCAAEAHRGALERALAAAVAEGALRRIEAELRATRLRRNAIVHTWIPAHEKALRTLELALEELEREDGVAPAAGHAAGIGAASSAAIRSTRGSMHAATGSVISVPTTVDPGWAPCSTSSWGQAPLSRAAPSRSARPSRPSPQKRMKLRRLTPRSVSRCSSTRADPNPRQARIARVISGRRCAADRGGGLWCRRSARRARRA